MSDFVRRASSFAAGCLAASMLLGQPAWAAGPFEGQWSVVVTPENGGCDGPYVLPVRVVENRIIYIGKGQFEADGGVGPDGAVRVTFASQGDRLDARGKMSSDSFGLGSWKSPSEDCDGTWIARKR